MSLVEVRSMDLNATMARVAEQFRIGFEELTRHIEHPGESGGAREALLRRVLSDFLPKRVEVGSGFVIDASGGQSRQVDIVIYDSGLGTVFDVGGVSFFPCETVIAVGSVKTRIESNDALQDTLENIASVKALDRSNGGTNLPVTGPGYSMTPPFHFKPATEHRDQILGFIFTGVSMKEETLIAALQAWNSAHPPTVWPNIYCDFTRFLVSYETDDYLTTSAMDAKNLYVTGEEEQPRLLLTFLTLIASFVNEAHIARPPLFDYAQLKNTIHRDYPLT